MTKALLRQQGANQGWHTRQSVDQILKFKGKPREENPSRHNLGAEASSLSLPAEDMIDCLGNPGQWAEEFLGLRRERSKVAGLKKKSVPLSSFLYTAGTKEKRARSSNNKKA